MKCYFVLQNENFEFGIYFKAYGDLSNFLGIIGELLNFLIPKYDLDRKTSCIYCGKTTESQ